MDEKERARLETVAHEQKECQTVHKGLFEMGYQLNQCLKISSYHNYYEHVDLCVGIMGTQCVCKCLGDKSEFSEFATRQLLFTFVLSLSCPWTVPLTHHKTAEDGTKFMVMPWAGHKLHFKSKHNTLGLFRQLLYGLVFLQDNGISHNDLRRENLVVDPRCQKLRILDFGSSSYYTTNQSKQMCALWSRPLECHPVYRMFSSEATQMNSQQIYKMETKMNSQQIYKMFSSETTLMTSPQCYGCKVQFDIGRAFDIWGLGMLMYGLLYGTEMCQHTDDQMYHDVVRHRILCEPLGTQPIPDTSLYQDLKQHGKVERYIGAMRACLQLNPMDRCDARAVLYVIFGNRLPVNDCLCKEKLIPFLIEKGLDLPEWCHQDLLNLVEYKDVETEEPINHIYLQLVAAIKRMSV